MSCSDPIADMLTRIRNACKAGLPAVEMGHSRLKAEIARLLKKRERGPVHFAKAL